MRLEGFFRKLALGRLEIKETQIAIRDSTLPVSSLLIKSSDSVLDPGAHR
jgi:hypothetical protein